MTDPESRSTIDRRKFVLGTATTMALLPLGTSVANAKATSETYSSLSKKATAGKLALDMPDLAENGALVPFTATVDSPMTPADHVKTIYMFAPSNPSPAVGEYDFTPASGLGMVIGRMRLAKTQEVVAFAEMADGKFYIAKKNVKVTAGGCAG